MFLLYQTHQQPVYQLLHFIIMVTRCTPFMRQLPSSRLLTIRYITNNTITTEIFT